MAEIVLVGGTNAGSAVSADGAPPELLLNAQQIGFQRQIGGEPEKEKYVLVELSTSDGKSRQAYVYEGVDALSVLLRHYQISR